MIMYTKNGDNLRLNDEINLIDKLQFYMAKEMKEYNTSTLAKEFYIHKNKLLRITYTKL